MLKRKRPDDKEAQYYQRDESFLDLTSIMQNIAHRCVAISTILRNPSFVPGNEQELMGEPLL